MLVDSAWRAAVNWVDWRLSCACRWAIRCLSALEAAGWGTAAFGAGVTTAVCLADTVFVPPELADATTTPISTSATAATATAATSRGHSRTRRPIIDTSRQPTGTRDP